MSPGYGDVKRDGTVFLGPSVCADGFDANRRIRVQTHVHEDHMGGFDRSKGYQQWIVMSRATRDLLIAYNNAELPYRWNLKTVAEGDSIRDPADGFTIDTKPTGHMMGTVQARVTYPDGYRVAYSSDFNWPPPGGVLTCDELVIDSTHGDPELAIEYGREEIFRSLRDIVSEEITRGPVVIFGYRGRLQLAMEFLRPHLEAYSFITTPRQLKVAEVYREYGHDLGDLVADELHLVQEVFRSRQRCVFFYEPGELERISSREAAFTISLTSFLTPREVPVLRHGRVCRVALTDHADFEGTIRFVKASEACRVVTDNSRGGNASALARYLREELGIDARPATLPWSRAWGN